MSSTQTQKKQPIVDKQLARAINQYLSQTGFKNTSAALQEECESKKILLNKSTKNNPIRNGQLDDYKDKNEYKQNLADLKHYLEEGPGSKLAVNSELVPYFALPYVSDIQKHPVFKELLQKNWTRSLQDQIVEEIAKSFAQQSDSDSDEEPKLITWRKAYENLKSDQESSLSEREAAKDYRDLQEDYYKIIDIASELIDCLEQAYQGKSVSPDFFIDISTRLFASPAKVVQNATNLLQSETKGQKFESHYIHIFLHYICFTLK